MAYCVYTEVQNLCGTDLSSTILGAIIDEADREIDAYIAPYNLTGSASGAVKSASLKLSQAGVIQYGGGYASTTDALSAIIELRKEAFNVLDLWISENSTTSSSFKLVVRA